MGQERGRDAKGIESDLPTGAQEFIGSDSKAEKGTADPNVYAYLDPLPEQIDKTVTDSEGRFSLTLPPGEYALLAVEHRDIGGKKEFYQWLVKAQPKTVLTNNNLAGRGDSLLPKRFALP